MRVAAVQLEAKIADVGWNIARCEELVREAAAEGAELVALPEFFTTAAAFDPRLATASLPFDGPATRMLSSVAEELKIHVGGSFLCRDADGDVRNAYALAAPDGRILGRHDKDLPTMWENALYVGGQDDGVIDAGDFTAGAAVCWELMRSATAHRLRGRVDVVIGGSNWWSIPSWQPRAISRRMETANSQLARRAPSVFGRYVGAPVVHGAICGRFSCPMPTLPGVRYRGHFEGNALVADAAGEVLARRDAKDGSGVAVADVPIGRSTPSEQVPARFWLHRRGAMATWSWHAERLHGRRWYARNVRAAPEPAKPTDTRW